MYGGGGEEEEEGGSPRRAVCAPVPPSHVHPGWVLHGTESSLCTLCSSSGEDTWRVERFCPQTLQRTCEGRLTAR